MSDEHISIAEYCELTEDQRNSPNVVEKLSSEDLRELWKYYVLDRTTKKAINNEFVKRFPDWEKTAYNENPRSREGRNYPVLSFISSTLKVFSVFGIIVGLVAMIHFIDYGETEKGLLIMLASVVNSIILYMIGEAITVFMDIASYMYKILKHLRDNTNKISDN